MADDLRPTTTRGVVYAWRELNTAGVDRGADSDQAVLAYQPPPESPMMIWDGRNMTDEQVTELRQAIREAESAPVQFTFTGPLPPPVVHRYSISSDDEPSHELIARDLFYRTFPEYRDLDSISIQSKLNPHLAYVIDTSDAGFGIQLEYDGENAGWMCVSAIDPLTGCVAPYYDAYFQYVMMLRHRERDLWQYALIHVGLASVYWEEHATSDSSVDELLTKFVALEENIYAVLVQMGGKPHRYEFDGLSVDASGVGHATGEFWMEARREMSRQKRVRAVVTEFNPSAADADKVVAPPEYALGVDFCAQYPNPIDPFEIAALCEAAAVMTENNPVNWEMWMEAAASTTASIKSVIQVVPYTSGRFELSVAMAFGLSPDELQGRLRGEMADGQARQAEAGQETDRVHVERQNAALPSGEGSSGGQEVGRAVQKCCDQGPPVL